MEITKVKAIAFLGKDAIALMAFLLALALQAVGLLLSAIALVIDQISSLVHPAQLSMIGNLEVNPSNIRAGSDYLG